MVENYLVLDGRRVDLTAEQLKTLGIEVKKNPFRCDRNAKRFWFIDCFGNPTQWVKGNPARNENQFTRCLEGWGKNLNTFSDPDFVKQTAWRQLLERQLRDFSYENGLTNDLYTNVAAKYIIFYDILEQTFKSSRWNGATLGTPIFTSTQVAERAIREIVEPFVEEHPDFVWGM